MSHHTVREWIAAHNLNKQLTQVHVIKDIEDGKDDNNSVEWGFILLLIKILEFDFAYELLRFDKNVCSCHFYVDSDEYKTSNL